MLRGYAEAGRSSSIVRFVQEAQQAKAVEAAAVVKEEEEEAAAQQPQEAAPMEEDDGDEVDPLDAFMANEILPAVHQNGAVAPPTQVCMHYSLHFVTSHCMSPRSVAPL